MEGWTMVAVIGPLIVIQLSLMIAALIDLARREAVRGGSKLVWALVIVLINIIGPILYLLWGREGEVDGLPD
jgi:ATP/ADP translocase